MSVVEVDRPQEVRVVDPYVEEGARVLDEIRPGWADKVDLDDFDIQNPTRCVLAQVYRNHPKENGFIGFARGSNDLHRRGYSWISLGFCGKRRNADWRLVIQARKTR